LGAVANYYYTLPLKKHPSPEQHLSYMANRWIAAGVILMTFCYAEANILFFCEAMSRSTELRYIKPCYLEDHVVLAGEISQKMEANRVVVLALRFFRVPERELVATGRAMATILGEPNP
jgi:acyl-coenzyme A thioesterase PaaI-like protein